MALKARSGLEQLQLDAAEREIANRTKMPLQRLDEFAVFHEDLGILTENGRGITGMLYDCGDLICDASFHDIMAHLLQADEAGQLRSDDVLAMMIDRKNEGDAKLFIEASSMLISSLRSGGMTFVTDEGAYPYALSDIKRIERLIEKINELKGTS